MKSKDEIINLIINTIKENVEYTNIIDKDTSLEIIGINSVGYVRTIVYLENILGIEFDDSLDYESFKTIEDIANYIIEDRLKT